MSSCPGGRRVSTLPAHDVRETAGHGDFTEALAQSASAAALAGWFRSEIGGPARAADGLGAPAGVRDRILIGAHADMAEARIRIGTGPLAGTELSLTASSGGRLVEATLLTCAAGSRQTLSVALEEIRVRLRGKGIVLLPETRR
jgi:hypothetical protein